MKHWMAPLVALAFLAFAAPAVAQQEDPAEETPDSIAPETPDDIADETPDEPIGEETEVTGEEPADAPADEVAVTHDWEFALQPTNEAVGAGGTVQVTEGETDNDFVVQVTALPVVDSLDRDDQDVAAYTVWIVPSKDQVQQSTLAGALTVDADGTGSFEGTTSLDTFGIIITATADGAPAQISGIPVLTGIPAAPATEETPAEELAPADTSAAEPLPGETPAGAETPEALPPAEIPPAETPDAPPPPAAEPTPEAEPVPPAEPTPDADALEPPPR